RAARVRSARTDSRQESADPGRTGQLSPAGRSARPASALKSASDFFAAVLPARSRDDLFHDRGLGVGVVLHVLPISLCELALGALVKLAVGIVAPEVIAEQQHPPDFRAPIRKDMKIYIGVRTLEQPMLVPLRFADSENISH